MVCDSNGDWKDSSDLVCQANSCDIDDIAKAVAYVDYSSCHGKTSGEVCTPVCSPGTDQITNVSQPIHLVCDDDGDFAHDIALTGPVVANVTRLNAPLSNFTAGFATPASCTAINFQANQGSGVYTIYPDGPTGTSYQVYCDLSTDGGGWMLMYAYNHIGGQNNALVEGTVPTDPNNGYSHVNVNHFTGWAEADIEDVRFYCHTSAHNRVIHFKTSNNFHAGAAWDGSSSGNSAGYWSSGYTGLPGHSAYLPAATTSVYSGSNYGFWNFPFYKGGTYHWGIRGGGSRWECEDDPGSYQRTTLHQVWVRMHGTTAACASVCVCV